MVADIYFIHQSDFVDIFFVMCTSHIVCNNSCPCNSLHEVFFWVLSVQISQIIEGKQLLLDRIVSSCSAVCWSHILLKTKNAHRHAETELNSVMSSKSLLSQPHCCLSGSLYLSALIAVDTYENCTSCLKCLVVYT